MIEVFMMCVRGAASCVENSLNTLAGMSSIIGPLFISNCDKCSFTFEIIVTGISHLLKAGMFVSDLTSGENP